VKIAQISNPFKLKYMKRRKRYIKIEYNFFEKLTPFDKNSNLKTKYFCHVSIDLG
jgi:hypothetical protein